MRFADLPAEAPREGKRKKKRLVKKTKAITPLQAMMLRMAGTSLYICRCCFSALLLFLKTTDDGASWSFFRSVGS